MASIAKDVWDDKGVITATTANPAAGAEATGFTVPSGSRYLFLGAVNELVASADVANRTTQIDVTLDGSTTAYYLISSTAQTASQTKSYHWLPMKSVGETVVGDHFLMGFGLSQGIEIPATGTVAFTTTNIEAADNWGATTYWYKVLPQY